MRKKLTITVEKRVYDGLHRRIGTGNISQFIEGLVRPHVIPRELDAAYREMAADTRSEAEALEWSEALIGDIDDDSRATRPVRLGKSSG